MIESANFNGDDLKVVLKFENLKTSIPSDSKGFLFINFRKLILTGR